MPETEDQAPLCQVCQLKPATYAITYNHDTVLKCSECLIREHIQLNTIEQVETIEDYYS